jgi:hypothetical protein
MNFASHEHREHRWGQASLSAGGRSNDFNVGVSRLPEGGLNVMPQRFSARGLNYGARRGRLSDRDAAKYEHRHAEFMNYPSRWPPTSHARDTAHRLSYP